MTLETIYDGDGSDVTFNTNFNYLEKEDISVAVKPSGGSYASKTLDTHYTVSGQVVTFTSGNVPPNNSKVRIRRHTPVTQPRHTFYAGSTVTAKSLNDNTNQILNALEERGLAVDDETDQPFTIGTHNEIKVNSATNLEVVAGKITLDKMAINSVDSDQYVDGSIDLVHMSANSVDSDQYVDGSIDNVHIADTTLRLEDKSGGIPTDRVLFRTEGGSGTADWRQLTTNTLADDAVTVAKMGNNSVDSDQYVDGSVDLVHLSASGTKNSTTFLRGDNTWHATASLGLFTSYAILTNKENQNVSGGSSGTSWTTRAINTEEADPDGIVSISSNQFTLQAGNYFINVAANAYDCGVAKLRIKDITNTAVRIVGHAGAGRTTGGIGTPNHLVGRLTPSAATAYELQQISAIARTNTGHGVPTNLDDKEIYTTIQIFKESS